MGDTSLKTRSTLGLMTVCVTFLSACVASMGEGPARVLEPNKSHLSVGLEAAWVNAAQGPTDVGWPWLQLGGSYHHGVSQRVELGARAWAIGLGDFGFDSFALMLDSKFALKQAPSQTTGWDISLSNSIGYHQVNVGGYAYHVPLTTTALRFGANVGGGSQVVFGPRFGYQIWAGNGFKTQHTFWPGVSVGYWWVVGKTVRLMPELLFQHSPIRFNGESKEETRYGLSTLQFSFSTYWVF